MYDPIPAGPDEAQLAKLVDRFYDKVGADPMLGPVFDPVVKDWTRHKALMTTFWSTVALRTARYRGNSLGKHQPLGIGNAHFERWLALWRETVHEVLPDPESAELMTGYAERIGYGMRVGLGISDHARRRDREGATAKPRTAEAFSAPAPTPLADRARPPR